MTDSNSNIIASGEAGYKTKVMRIVDMILRTKTGKAIDFLIRSTHGAVLIVESDADDANAETDKLRSMVARIKYYPNTGMENAEVSLKMGSTTMKVRNILHYPGFRPDEALFHELVHAARLLGGEKHDDNFWISFLRDAFSDKDAVNVEEFVAVLVTNIYISEKGGSSDDLRYHYQETSRPVLASEVEPYVFLFQYDPDKDEDHFKLIEMFCRQHPTIAPMIAKAPAKFNPIRDYYSLSSNLVDLGLHFSEGPGPFFNRSTQTQHETYVSINDDYLIGLLEPHTHADDRQREKKLARVFGSLTMIEAVPLILRLVASKNAGDKVATLFRHRLAPASRAKLINILRRRITQ